MSLLEIPGSYLRVHKEYTISGPSVLSRRNAFRYFCFPRTVHTDPSALERNIKNISLLFEQWGVQLEASKK